MIGVGMALTVLYAVAIATLFGRVLRALPIPDDDPPPDYAALDTPRFVGATVIVATAAGLITAWRSPMPLLWCPLVLALVPACAIDARTTYLPLRLTQAGWVLGAACVAISAASRADASLAIRAAVGAGVVGAAFWLAWRLGMIGFGDVRLMITVGGVMAAASWGVFIAGLLAGALVGAGWGAVRWLRGRAGAFPYGPGLLAGPFVALLVGAGS